MSEMNNTANFESDISLSLAVSAFNGTSFSPERRGSPAKRLRNPS